MSTEVALNTFRQDIARLEELLFQLPQVECPLKHTFDRGVYTREFFLAKGIIGTGKVHTYSCINILMSGTLHIVSEADGKQTFQAPCLWVSPAGTKRMFYGETDVYWVTVHRIDTTDIPTAERELFSATYEEYEEKVRILQGDKL